MVVVVVVNCVSTSGKSIGVLLTKVQKYDVYSAKSVVFFIVK
jgi:hypothetical protein